MKLLFGFLLAALPLFVASDDVVPDEAAPCKAGTPPLPPCIDDPLPKKCPNYFDPVCGTDDRDYNNICLLQQKSVWNVNHGYKPIYLSYGGPCYCNCKHCSRCYKPVCGSDKRTYWNKCWLQCYDKCNKGRNQPWIWQKKTGYC